MKNLRQHTDDELVAMYANGNNVAFDTLLERYKSKLYSYIFYSVQNEDLAEDIFQETFTKAIIRIQKGSYVANDKFYAWITRIAHNLILDQYRQRNQENWISNDECENDLFNNINLADSSHESQLVYTQVLADVKRLYMNLPENQSEIVRMRFYENMSFKDIAEKLDISINTALGRMRYALYNIRKMANQAGISLTLS